MAVIRFLKSGARSDSADCLPMPLLARLPTVQYNLAVQPTPTLLELSVYELL